MLDVTPFTSVPPRVYWLQVKEHIAIFSTVVQAFCCDGARFNFCHHCAGWLCSSQIHGKSVARAENIQHIPAGKSDHTLTLTITHNI